MSEGSRSRVTDRKRYAENYDRIFGTRRTAMPKDNLVVGRATPATGEFPVPQIPGGRLEMPAYLRVLAIDPGTRCGYCLGRHGERPVLDAWDLAPKRHEGGGMRFLRLRNYLGELLRGEDTMPRAVVYEEVRRHLGTTAAHVYGGIVAEITAACELHNIPYRGVPVQHIKKHATGKGNASKDEMLAAMRRRFPNTDVTGFDEADALALWSLMSPEFRA